MFAAFSRGCCWQFFAPVHRLVFVFQGGRCDKLSKQIDACGRHTWTYALPDEPHFVPELRREGAGCPGTAAQAPKLGRGALG